MANTIGYPQKLLGFILELSFVGSLPRFPRIDSSGHRAEDLGGYQNQDDIKPDTGVIVSICLKHQSQFI
jgi:hypothetical protein